MSDEELERAYKEFALGVAHQREKDRKKYAQLIVWQSFVIDEKWHRCHNQFIKNFREKWDGEDFSSLDNIQAMLSDIVDMLNVGEQNGI